MSQGNKKSLIVLVHGASGRMGKEILQLAKSTPGIREALPLSREDKGKLSGDVVVDFSLPSGLENLLKRATDSGLPLVSGTTGFSKDQMDMIKTASKKIPILWSANMSFGVHLFLRMLKEFRHVPNWDIKMSETHHIHKKDSPSGTALWLRSELEAVVGKSIDEPVGHRVGEVVGDHEVLGRSPLEEITLTHRALNRKVFAEGALKACLWLPGKGPGLYSLSDLLDNRP